MNAKNQITMHKLPVFYRLVAGNLVVLLLATLIGAYAIWQLGKMRALTSQIVHTDNQLINLGNDLSNTMLSCMRYEKKYLLLHDQSLYAEYQAARLDFEQLLKQAFTYGQNKQIHSILLKVQRLGNQYDELLQQGLAQQDIKEAEQRIANTDEVKEQLLNGGCKIDCVNGHECRLEVRDPDGGNEHGHYRGTA